MPIAANVPQRAGPFRTDGARIPYAYFTSPEIYAREQALIFRGPTWSFLGLEAEIPQPGDFKSTGFKRNPAGPSFDRLKTKPPASGISPNDYAGNFEAFLNREAGLPKFLQRGP